jgi:hypothetical protein
MNTDEWRQFLKASLRSELERTLDERIDRYVSVNRQQFIPSHHFSPAISECLGLYRDGNFISCVMVTQAITEAIARFVAERNGITQGEKEQKQQMVGRLQQGGILTAAFEAAFTSIQRSFRNDFHHMNPTVASIDIGALATRNINDLAAIQNEIFGFSIREGRVLPNQIKYWDPKPDGTVRVHMVGH